MLQNYNSRNFILKIVMMRQITVYMFTIIILLISLGSSIIRLRENKNGNVIVNNCNVCLSKLHA